MAIKTSKKSQKAKVVSYWRVSVGAWVINFKLQ